MSKYENAIGLDERNIGTAKLYLDAKMKGYYLYKGIDVGTEIKFLYGQPHDDENDKGMSFNPVYDYFSKHFE